jgi:hypothetical protein
MNRNRTPALYAGIGLAAGFFSALFGIGGGFVIVPFLILAGRFPSKTAAGTSLAAIGLTAISGVIAFQVIGAVEWGPVALTGIPAACGALMGTWLQQRVSSAFLVLLLALFLVVVAGVLAVR